MKVLAAAVFFATLGLVQADSLKKEMDDSDYDSWKKAVVKTKEVVEEKDKKFAELVNKMGEDDKKVVQGEIAKVTKAKDEVNTEVKKVTDLEESEFKKATDDKMKKAVATNAGKAGITVAEKLLAFENVYKTATLAYTKQVATKEGAVKILEYLKSKVESLEKDGFLTSSLVAAAALTAFAVGSSMH